MVLLDDADVTGDAALTLRLAAVAAERNLPISRDALNLLGRRAPDVSTPWPDELRDTLVRVLAAGPAAIPALEALDQRRLFERYLPEWATVRNKPQRNPYHRFTVDRHLLEATANAATMAHRVRRVDLLLLGALLHDIGKGYPGDHTDVGMVVAADIATRMGLPPEDVATIVTMVRLHLLLPDTATRRDLDDPATAQRVADEVGDRTTLELLAAMVEADSLATGPSAWGSLEGRPGGRPGRAGRPPAGRRAGRPAGPVDHRGPPGGHGHRPDPRGAGPVHRGAAGHRGGPRPLGPAGRGDRGAGPPRPQRALGRGGRRARGGRRDLHRGAGPGPLAGVGQALQRPGRGDGRHPRRRRSSWPPGPTPTATPSRSRWPSWCPPR